MELKESLGEKKLSELLKEVMYRALGPFRQAATAFSMRGVRLFWTRSRGNDAARLRGSCEIVSCVLILCTRPRLTRPGLC